MRRATFAVPASGSRLTDAEMDDGWFVCEVRDCPEARAAGLTPGSHHAHKRTIVERLREHLGSDDGVTNDSTTENLYREAHHLVSAKQAKPAFHFTPGPLTARRYVRGAQYLVYLESRDTGIVAALTCAEDDHEARAALDADANLFLAAHDALAACVELIHGDGTGDSLQRTIDLARQALATALNAEPCP